MLEPEPPCLKLLPLSSTVLNLMTTPMNWCHVVDDMDESGNVHWLVDNNCGWGGFVVGIIHCSVVQ